MKEFLLNNDWIFGVFGILIFVLAIKFKDFWVGASSKLEDVIVWYSLIILVYGSVKLWTDFFKWLLK